MSALLAEVTTTSVDTGAAMGALFLWFVVVYVLFAIPLMLVFRKADRPVWAALIPIYNIYVLLRLVGRPGWWLILFLIPFVSLIVWIIVAYDLARSFGHGAGFTVGLVLLSWVFLLILGVNSSRYLGPAAEMPGLAGPPATV